jgi:hypothetical protein
MTELAQQFFSIANAVTAFCVGQTVAFLFAFAKDSRIIAALLRWRPYSSALSKWTGSAYMIGVIGCGVAEFWLRYKAGQPGQRCAPLGACAIAVALRCGAVYLTSSFYLRIFVEACREEDWLNKNQPDREFQIPRLLHKLSKSENRLYQKAKKVDDVLFKAPLEEVIHAKDFLK